MASSKPFPVTVPVPASERDFLLRKRSEDDVKSKVNPPTLQRSKEEVEDPKDQGVDIVTPLPGAAYGEKKPLSLSTRGVIQPVMFEALVKGLLLNLAEPPMVMLPVIELAGAVEVRDKSMRPPKSDKVLRRCGLAPGDWSETGVFGLFFINTVII